MASALYFSRRRVCPITADCSSTDAATLVAFGTSLPELVTAVQAARKGHGDLAVGNIIGADILNALFVAGAAAAVTPAGLTVAQSFFWPAFPAMLFVLVVFRTGIYVCRTQLTRKFGIVLLAAYLAYIGVSIAVGVRVMSPSSSTKKSSRRELTLRRLQPPSGSST